MPKRIDGCASTLASATFDFVNSSHDRVDQIPSVILDDGATQWNKRNCSILLPVAELTSPNNAWSISIYRDKTKTKRQSLDLFRSVYIYIYISLSLSVFNIPEKSLFWLHLLNLLHVCSVLQSFRIRGWLQWASRRTPEPSEGQQHHRRTTWHFKNRFPRRNPKNGTCFGVKTEFQAVSIEIALTSMTGTVWFAMLHIFVIQIYEIIKLYKNESYCLKESYPRKLPCHVSHWGGCPLPRSQRRRNQRSPVLTSL